jgi:hypothetical protein
MPLAVFASTGYLDRTMTGLAVLIVLVVTPTHAQQPSLACTLLQVVEIESALGGKASTKLSGFSQNVQGMALDECSVEISGPGQNGIRRVGISIVKNLPMDGGEAIRTRNAGTAREPQWKGTGARLEEKTVGDAICIMFGRPGVAGHSTCSIPRAKGYAEVDVTASVQEMASLDVVRALVQKAVTRL